MFLIFKKNYSLILKFIKFGIVGTIGLVFDFSILFYLVEFINFRPEHARFFSLPTVIFFTWYLNRKLTFKDNNKRVYKQLSKYYLFMFLGVTVNYSIFYFLLDVFKNISLNYFIALVIASGSSMMINFINMKLFVFRNSN